MNKCKICGQEIISEGICCECSNKAYDLGIQELFREKEYRDRIIKGKV
jgi:ribosomal protein L32